MPETIYHLFVKTEFHERGIGRRLWLHARDWILDTYDSAAITVNSSLNAVSIYEKLGFASNGDVAENNEVKFHRCAGPKRQNKAIHAEPPTARVDNGRSLTAAG